MPVQTCTPRRRPAPPPRCRTPPGRPVRPRRAPTPRRHSRCARASRPPGPSTPAPPGPAPTPSRGRHGIRSQIRSAGRGSRDSLRSRGSPPSPHATPRRATRRGVAAQQALRLQLREQLVRSAASRPSSAVTSMSARVRLSSPFARYRSSEPRNTTTIPSASSMPSLASECRSGAHEVRQHLTFRTGSPPRPADARPTSRGPSSGSTRSRYRCPDRWSDRCWISPRTHRCRRRGKDGASAASTSS